LTFEGTLTTDASTFTFAHTAPDTKLLAVGEGIFETVDSYDTTAANVFGLAGGSTTLGEEQIGVDPEAVG